MTVGAATEQWSLSATGLAEVIWSRQASSQDVIEAHLVIRRRPRRLHGALGATGSQFRARRGEGRWVHP